MKPTDFSIYLTRFLGKYLPMDQGASKHTIASYRDTFTIMLKYLYKEHNLSAEKISLSHLTKDMIIEFLDWLETERHNSVSTRNVRLAALHAFFRYLQYEHPENLLEWQRILSIPVKRAKKTVVNFMSLEGIELLMNQPDRSKVSGRRDLAMLALLYDSAARVQELIDLTPSCIRFEQPCSIKLTGKGNKTRIVPLMPKESKLLKNYMEEHDFFESWKNEYPLFYNKRKEALTRSGVNYILGKYVAMAKQEDSTLIPDKFTPHCLRHSKSMHLLQAGVNLVYIRDILGHVSIQTTEIYARADSKQKRIAIEGAYYDVLPKQEAKWQHNPDILEWLKSLC